MLLIPLALLASLLDGLLLGGIRVFLALLTDKWPSQIPRLPVDGEWRVFFWIGSMALVLLLRWLVLVVRARGSERMARGFEATLQAWWIRMTRSLHPRYFHSSAIMGRLRSAAQATAILPAGSGAVVQAVQAFFQLLLFMPVLIWISWPLALALFLGLVPWIAWMQRRIQAIGPDLDAHIRMAGEYEADTVDWARLLRSWVGGREQSRFLHMLLTKIRELRLLGTHVGTRKALLAQSMEALSVFGTVLVMGLCALLVGRGDMTAEDFVLFCSALFICYKPFKEFSRLAPQLRDLQSAYRTLVDLENCDRWGQVATVSETDDSLEIEGVVFRYEGAEKAVFDGLHKTLALEKPVLLKGANGAGKTSLLRLLAGLELPLAGSIVLPARARSGVFHLSQRLHLPPVAWLADELSAGTWGPACERLFDELGLRNLLAKNGHSGGELQRIGLGWAVVSRAPLVFLDEPLAFVAQRMRPPIFEAFWNATRENGQWWIMASHEPAPAAYDAQMDVWELGEA